MSSTVPAFVQPRLKLKHRPGPELCFGGRKAIMSSRTVSSCSLLLLDIILDTNRLVIWLQQSNLSCIFSAAKRSCRGSCHVYALCATPTIRYFPWRWMEAFPFHCINFSFFIPPCSSLELVEMLKSCQHHLLARLLYLSSQKDLVQNCIDFLEI